MQKSGFIALTPASLGHPSIAIAASRDGGLGVLDLEYAPDERTAFVGMPKLAHST